MTKILYLLCQLNSNDEMQFQMGIGFYWLALTLVFEFSLGLWQVKSWQVMLKAYTFKGGNIWPVVLAVTTLAPYLAAKLRS